MIEWIKISDDNLPPLGETVLAYEISNEYGEDEYYLVHLHRKKSKKRSEYWFQFGTFTHRPENKRPDFFAYLPNPPKEV